MDDADRAWEWVETHEFATAVSSLTALLAAVRAEERERCARVCDVAVAEFPGDHRFVEGMRHGIAECVTRIRGLGGVDDGGGEDG